MQTTNVRQATGKEGRVWDLEERTFRFAADRRALIRKLPRDVPNIGDSKQLARASGSVGANYIEANDALGKKDFQLHIKICRKESKESAFFLRLVKPLPEDERRRLVQEAIELKSIFSKMLLNSEKT